MSPNPMVGAVIERDGAIVGEGWHRQVGGPHAEVEALAAAGARARGATLHVTLEPCCHHGRTPPCVEAILAAGIRRVVACHRDPNPRVAGGGFERLRAAGVEVEVGALAPDAVRLNLRFLASTVLGRPEVTLKWAMSVDGRIATAAGESRWISSPASRRWSLALREEHDAIVAGSGTVLADDPRLDRRLGLAAGPNLRVVLDRRLRVAASARLFALPGPVVVYTESRDAARQGALVARGAEVVELPAVTPATVLDHLRGRGVTSVLVEGGGAVHAAFAASGCFDRLLAICAPLLIGGERAPGPLGGAGLGPLAKVPRLGGLTARRRGDDVILEGYREGCLPALFASVGAS